MKPIYRILFTVMCLLPAVAGAAPVATTAGNNLTAYNASSGASANNNQWNTMLNSRGGGTDAPKADFGNCNAVIMRCASPKCSGCTTLEIARPIVAGCVNANATCKQYGNDLIEYISAQLVSSAAAKSQQTEIAAQTAAASAAAAQTNAQMQQMQQQMQQMQYDMQQQSAMQLAQFQAALEEQKQMTAAAQEQASAAQAPAASGLTAAQQDAISRNVDPELIAREQIEGQIMSRLENAETALKALKGTMTNVFDYAGCDARGNNCKGPKRVAVFKEKAMAFFDPYNDVLDEMYEALVTAQSAGVDINDIYMLLNGSCNSWGEYLCTGVASQVGEGNNAYYDWPKYNREYNKDTQKIDQETKDSSNKRTYPNCGTDNKSIKGGLVLYDDFDCYDGQVIPPENLRGCTLQRILTDKEDVQRAWLDTQSGDNMIRVGCASTMLERSKFLGNRKQQSSIEIDTLERMILQDAPGDKFKDCNKWCASDNQKSDLKKNIASKGLNDKVCVKETTTSNQKHPGTESKECSGETYIHPMYALCSIHACNNNKTAQPTDDAERDDMREIIGLKTTVLSQQMNKQYEYMESMIQRFKTQLEKAVLTTRLAVASGDNNKSKSDKDESKDTGWKAQLKNCNLESTDSGVLDCYEKNLDVFKSELAANGPSSELRNEMVDYYKSLSGQKYSTVKDEEKGKCPGDGGTQSYCTSNMSNKKETFENCISNYAQCLRLRRGDYAKHQANIAIKK